MPQFQFDSNLWQSQIFWLVITFTVLLFLVHSVIAPRIQKIFDAREQKLTADMTRAEELKVEIEKMLTAKEELLATARQDADDLYRKEMEKVKKEVAKKQATAQAEIDKKLAATEKKIEAGRQKALKDVEKVATDIAAQVVESITGEKADTKAIAKSVKAVPVKTAKGA